MRCPKCGAFLEQGKVVCNMCGTNSTTYIPEVTNNNFNNDGMFSTGMNTGNGDFSSYNPAINNYKNVSTKKEYHDVELVPVKNGEADIFDFFSSNKKLLTFGGIILLFAVIGLAGWKYYDVRSKEPVLEPVFSELYYEVDSGFRDVSTSNGTKLYTKTGDKGSDCSIKINYGASTSDDHVYEYFATIHANLEPEKDTNGKIVNQLDVYTPSEGSMKLNENTWHYINLFFKSSVNDDSATNLKYKYLTAVYNGYYYDIELLNNNNDAQCGASLDNFAKSLKFIDIKEKE